MLSFQLRLHIAIIIFWTYAACILNFNLVQSSSVLRMADVECVILSITRLWHAHFRIHFPLPELFCFNVGLLLHLCVGGCSVFMVHIKTSLSHFSHLGWNIYSVPSFTYIFKAYCLLVMLVLLILDSGHAHQIIYNSAIINLNVLLI